MKHFWYELQTILELWWEHFLDAWYLYAIVLLGLAMITSLWLLGTKERQPQVTIGIDLTTGQPKPILIP